MAFSSLSVFFLLEEEEGGTAELCNTTSTSQLVLNGLTQQEQECGYKEERDARLYLCLEQVTRTREVGGILYTPPQASGKGEGQRQRQKIF